MCDCIYEEYDMVVVGVLVVGGSANGLYMERVLVVGGQR